MNIAKNMLTRREGSASAVKPGILANCGWISFKDQASMVAV
jgi:hypothetical protein